MSHYLLPSVDRLLYGAVVGFRKSDPRLVHRNIQKAYGRPVLLLPTHTPHTKVSDQVDVSGDFIDRPGHASRSCLRVVLRCETDESLWDLSSVGIRRHELRLRIVGVTVKPEPVNAVKFHILRILHAFHLPYRARLFVQQESVRILAVPSRVLG